LCIKEYNYSSGEFQIEICIKQNGRLENIFKFPAVSSAEIQKAVKLAEESYCPVWVMLKGNVKIEAGFECRWALRNWMLSYGFMHKSI